MTNSLYISTTATGSGKALVALGIIDLILQKTPKVAFFRPIILENHGTSKDEDIELILDYFHLQQTYEEAFGLCYDEVNELLVRQKFDEIIERIINKFQNLEKKFDFIVCEGSDYLQESSAFEFELNTEIARNLGCPIIILGNAYHRQTEDAIGPIVISRDTYKDKGCPVIGIILNQADPEEITELKDTLSETFPSEEYSLAVIPYNAKLASPRVKEIVRQLDARVLYGHQRLEGLASHVLVVAMQMQNALQWLKEDSLVITPWDRGDVIIGMLQAHQSANYPNLAGILLTAGGEPEPSIARLIDGLPDPVPILSVSTDTYTTADRVHNVSAALTASDRDKIALSLQIFADHVNLDRLESKIRDLPVRGLTPKMFTHNLVRVARENKRHIVLPEGTEPRILQAAAVLLHQDIVDLTLLGKREDIETAIKKHGINLELDRLRTIEPATDPNFERYAETLYEARKTKGMNLDMARDSALDVSYFGTLMVYRGEADGMVSGAVHTTQHTIRPALQIIKTTPDCSVVSSVFFMCLEDRVLVYGDCAVNPDPTAEQLAEIAISSAETARRFGIEPRVALLSYSSGESGTGADVEKVRQATRLARTKRPDLKIEGPIQYDAAVDAAVAAQKMPGSEVAGKATVFIFPDLNTGNNTYKAVQRETGALAIGPILQGLKKPVNDLSRGCTVPDIINTVVITAIQSMSGQ
ncbi:phosphate acetyltransferase [Pannus brasiliensis CCIBt3594]|uniref:Phosphate acetyltransferase n=1 Tax=Pannus brasiliensis CCIBt3594 TaxID=1427578 RepID=A0AAW9QX50_9CHRO